MLEHLQHIAGTLLTKILDWILDTINIFYLIYMKKERLL